MSTNLRLAETLDSEPITPQINGFGDGGIKTTVMRFLQKSVRIIVEKNPYQWYQRRQNPPFKYFAKHAYERFVISQGAMYERD